MKLSQRPSRAPRELIDTLWNVNATLGSIVQDACSRINRYIMECKSKSKLTGEWLYIELIDTLWNVNALMDEDDPAFKRINRYIMECK